jgi:hypothetical protein
MSRKITDVFEMCCIGRCEIIGHTPKALMIKQIKTGVYDWYPRKVVHKFFEGFWVPQKMAIEKGMEYTDDSKGFNDGMEKLEDIILENWDSIY